MTLIAKATSATAPALLAPNIGPRTARPNTGVADVASISERRTDRFLDVARNHGLNAFLADDPGVPNWLSTAGHHEGRLWFRWFLAETLPERPRAEVVPFSSFSTR